MNIVNGFGYYSLERYDRFMGEDDGIYDSGRQIVFLNTINVLGYLPVIGIIVGFIRSSMFFHSMKEIPHNDTLEARCNLLDQKLDRKIAEFRALLRFVVIHRDLWNLFLKAFGDSSNEYSKEIHHLLNLIYKVIRENLCYEAISSVFNKDDIDRLRNQGDFDSDFVQVVLVKISCAFVGFNFFAKVLIGRFDQEEKIHSYPNNIEKVD